jgi:hypothetical protein
VGNAAMVASDSGLVYSIVKPVEVAFMVFMSKTSVPFGVSFCRPWRSLPSWPQLPSAPSPPR